MKLENQVVSLEYAKKLKELGVKQESIYYWRSVSNNTAPEPENWYYSHHIVPSDEPVPEHFNNARLRFCSAFTVAELGNLISTVKGIRLDSTRHTTMDEWSIAISETERIYADTEADARAKMLIYLLENNLITNN